ncbi:MAG: hypothetical protein K6T16_01090 [Candidatus Pacearchaeota archaeon]|nr:hypothetical protein [Candidatus Pacearchaeota archaeon]
MSGLDKLTLEQVRNMPEKQLWRTIVMAYQSPKKEEIIGFTEDLCSDWLWCREHKVPYIGLTSWDYWTVVAYVFLNYLQEQQGQNKPKEAASA